MFGRSRFVKQGFLVFGTLLLLLFSQVASALPTSEEAEAPSSEGTKESIDSSHWVEWLAAFDKDGDKVDDEAESIAGEHVAAGNPLTPVSVLINYDQMPGSVQVAELKTLGAGPEMYVFHHSPTINATIPASNVDDLSSIPALVAVEYDYPVEPMINVSAPSTQAVEGTGANNFYNGKTGQALGYKGEGMVIAVLDTGVNEEHDSLAGKFVAGASASSPVVVGCVNPLDDDGHGTHVASSALGNSPNVVGTAPSAKLVDIKISVSIASLAGGIDRGMDWVLDYNAAIDTGSPLCGVTAADRVDVVTVSFGSSGRGGPNAGTTEALVTQLNQSGVAVTIAVGNCGPSPSALCTFGDDDNGISSPGNAAGAIGVANFNDLNTVNRANDTISTSSSRGPNNGSGDSAAGGATSAADLKDRYRKPDVAGPGTNIVAADFASIGDDTASLSGTSMSTPQVAGLAAILLQAGQEVQSQTRGNLLAPKGSGFDDNLDYAPGVYPIRDALINHSAAYASDYKTTGIAPAAQKWTGPNSAGLQWNNAWGYGQVNAFDALCWAWANVLIPGGADVTPTVSEKCGLGGPLTASAGGPYGGLVNTPISLAGSGSGGTPPYTFAWSLTSGPAGASGVFADATAAATTFTPDTPGVYELGLTVTDTSSAVATSSASLTAHPPQPPGTETVLAEFNFDGSPTCPTQGWSSFRVFLENGQPSATGQAWHLERVKSDTEPCNWYHGDENLDVYLDAQRTSLESPTPATPGSSCFNLPATLLDARFDFRMAGGAEKDFDFMYVQVREGCGVGAWTTLQQYTDQHGDWLASTPTYVSKSVDLSGKIGAAPFQLRFVFDSDDILFEEGYRIDTFKLIGEVPNASPEANITGPGLLATGRSGHFDGSDSSDADGEIISHEWDMGDGTMLFGPSVDHAYSAAGNYTVKLTVTDDGGASDSATLAVRVTDPPIAVIHGPDALFTNEPGTFDGSDSRDPDGNVAAWEWDFGDGNSATGEVVEHTYSTAGTHTVTLEVTDNEGVSTVATHEVTVSSPPQPGAGEKRIFAKSLQEHECNATEWVFVITGFKGGISAPSSIHVTWGNRDQATIPLQGVSGGNAKYQTNLNLDSPVTEGAAVISEDWQGQFNLGRGPCF